VVMIDPDDLVRRELDESNNSAETTASIPAAILESDDRDGTPRLWIVLAALSAVVVLLSFLGVRRIEKLQRRRAIPGSFPSHLPRSRSGDLRSLDGEPVGSFCRDQTDAIIVLGSPGAAGSCLCIFTPP
jgi:hypothetical protein